ncbi:UDP-2,4-diacetamido-2,4,6-trideoxy-beta-L-altropyranose hydrolase [Pleomorphomonas koreensis]|uniref:UDP-2,4-diacetamido-2,4, 6-trideoxy-beta-L-altropyranose hydrolase n=1 Tax=Pleomorphomonas koreensis TaxID=257440 RepID=UPI00146D610E|nr:UDP-2,4-diacetamido-2,4,6-trideoxy-beta-L-altropyranose hydrolase [Pleomorphomonas koreensis]
MRRAIIRADASVLIGIGHVMRCLTLANALSDAGVEVHFICRDHPGHLRDLISARGFAVHMLRPGRKGYPECTDAPPHAAWLNAWPEDDAEACRRIIAEIGQTHLAIIDHYGLDRRFEALLRDVIPCLAVVDDLADRPHACDILLDQNAGREAGDYEGLVSQGTTVLAGTRWALLRPEFGQLREASIARRTKGDLTSILITMGGIDALGVTSRALAALANCGLGETIRVCAVMGGHSPHLQAVRDVSTKLPFLVEVLVDDPNMARRMLDADLALGAGGTTSWERCCLGLPSIVSALASNQTRTVDALVEAGAARAVRLTNDYEGKLGEMIQTLSRSPEAMRRMSSNAAALCDGLGTKRFIEAIRLDAAPRP